MSSWFTCIRCDNKNGVVTMSRFNTDIICNDCERDERMHPRYTEAYDAELAEARKGNYNFPGIGKPPDL
jgi:hypothetical protein